MTTRLYCSVCQRVVYVDENDTPVCPVCSTPLIEAVPIEPEEGDPPSE